MQGAGAICWDALEESAWVTTSNTHWRDDIARRVHSDDWLLITGPPGVGKTYHMQLHYLAASQVGRVAAHDLQGRRVVRLDGSSDQFMLVAMSDWLQQAMPTTQPVLLIVDEFHMLLQELKDQLLQWVSSRPFIKLVMISNRYDFADEVLFGRHLAGSQRRAGLASIQANIVHCRGSLDEVLSVKVVPAIFSAVGTGDMASWLQRPMCDLWAAGPRVPAVLLFSRLWLQSSSMLMGDDLLSMRDVEGSPMLAALWHPRQDRCYQEEPEVQRALAGHLVQQVVHLRKFARSFVAAAVRVYGLDTVQGPAQREWAALGSSDRGLTIAEGLNLFNRYLVTHLASVRTSIPLGPGVGDDEALDGPLLLIQASLADPQSLAMPYPEFVGRGWVVPPITSFHPFDRLGLWCAYMGLFPERALVMDRDRGALTTSVMQTAARVRDALAAQFDVVDNPLRFPQLEEVRLHTTPVCAGHLRRCPLGWLRKGAQAPLFVHPLQ